MKFEVEVKGYRNGRVELRDTGYQGRKGDILIEFFIGDVLELLEKYKVGNRFKVTMKEIKT